MPWIGVEDFDRIQEKIENDFEESRSFMTKRIEAEERKRKTENKKTERIQKMSKSRDYEKIAKENFKELGTEYTTKKLVKIFDAEGNSNPHAAVNSGIKHVNKHLEKQGMHIIRKDIGLYVLQFIPSEKIQETSESAQIIKKADEKDVELTRTILDDAAKQQIKELSSQKEIKAGSETIEMPKFNSNIVGMSEILNEISQDPELISKFNEFLGQIGYEVKIHLSIIRKDEGK